MFARSTTIIGDPARIDAGVAHVRDEVLPAVTSMDGCQGMSLVVDRESGRCIATAGWESQETMRAAAERVSPMRLRAAEILGGTMQVEEWEVGVMHRDHDSREGARCRITWSRPVDVDRTLDFWRASLLPRFEQMAGFCSASMLVDRAGGRLCGTITYDSQATLEASRQGARMIREEGARETGVEFLDVAEFELAIAHLRLPELV